MSHHCPSRAGRTPSPLSGGRTGRPGCVRPYRVRLARDPNGSGCRPRISDAALDRVAAERLPGHRGVRDETGRGGHRDLLPGQGLKLVDVGAETVAGLRLVPRVDVEASTAARTAAPDRPVPRPDPEGPQARPYDANDFGLCYLCHAERPFVKTQRGPGCTGHRLLAARVPPRREPAGRGRRGTSIDTAPCRGEGLAICSSATSRSTRPPLPHKPGDAEPALVRRLRGLVNFAPNVMSRANAPGVDGAGRRPHGSCALTCHGFTHLASGTEYDTAPGTGLHRQPNHRVRRWKWPPRRLHGCDALRERRRRDLELVVRGRR